MDWKYLREESELNSVIESSVNHPVVIFKNSFSCGISAMMLDRFEKAQQPEGIAFYLLDVVKHRPLSRKLAERFKVTHQSPQVLLIQNKSCTYHASHSAISMEKVINAVDAFQKS